MAEKQEQRFVAVLMSDPKRLLDDKEYYGPMLRALSDTLLSRGLMMRPVQCLHDHQQQRFLEGPAGLYAGVVFLGQMYRRKDFIAEVAASMSGPKVMLDHHFDDIPIHSIREDAVAGMRMLTEHLLSLGHQRIAYVDNDNPDANPWKREGIDQALTQAGQQPLGPGWVAGCRFTFSDASAALEWFMDLDPGPSAIICAEDYRALHVFQAAAERAMRVPHDLSIAGYGDTAVRTGRSEILTSVAFDAAQMGRKAAELAAGAADAPPEAVMVSPTLMIRGSTGEPPK
jgi:LacI family transcriptional regulator